MDPFDIPINEDGKIIDFLSDSVLEPHPEEFVRQNYLRILHYEYQYPKSVLAREVSIKYGHKDLKDSKGNSVRADIVVYSSSLAKNNKDQGKIELLVECKAPSEQAGYNQLVSYIYNTSAQGGVWFNGNKTCYFRRLEKPTNQLVEWIGIPRKKEAWDALGRRDKSQLIRPKDIKGLLRRCHNKLHGRGVDGDEDDLTMDMVRIILAKAMDEERGDELPDFYCTSEEYSSEEGQNTVSKRIQKLFEEVKSINEDVFSPHEKISVGPRAICDVAVELQNYRLLSDLNTSDDWDIMGHAYEQYTASYLKKKRGQFFTNRLIVDLIVEMIDPDYQDLILDPAGGSGGFLTGAMRYVRKKILDSKATRVSKQRQLDKHRTRLFMVEISKRLVKIAKTAMILNGDGHSGMTQGDSLGDLTSLNDHVKALCGIGKPTVILTNPPFSGVGEGKITDTTILENFTTGIRWTNKGKEYQPTESLCSDGVPPEMLFFERCLNWIAPGGTIGIVMPKSFLDTQTYYPARHLLLDKYKLIAVINCHKNTFQPHTGVRTCIVFVERPLIGHSPSENYEIFMGINRKIGQDSEGFPIFIRDKNNNPTDELDHDLKELIIDFKDFKKGNFKQSEYRFTINKNNIDSSLRINPQAYLPNLHATIKKIEAVDSTEGWSVTTIGQLSQNIRIFKGPRLKSENIIVEKDGPEVEPYFTPSSILQEKRDSAKLLDISKATPAQLRTIDMIRIHEGDIVLTRSGTIGRVAYITKRLDNLIVSDDLIRIRIPDETLRIYVFSYLQTNYALDQMHRNEYGAVQQHLEPSHISDMLIPVPDNYAQVNEILSTTKNYIKSKEQLEEQYEKSQTETHKTLSKLIN